MTRTRNPNLTAKPWTGVPCRRHDRPYSDATARPATRRRCIHRRAFVQSPARFGGGAYRAPTHAKSSHRPERTSSMNVLVFEPDHTGHRLNYVRLIASALLD